MNPRWKNAQDEELKCWALNRVKLASREYLEVKKTYWRRLLQKLGLPDIVTSEARVLEVGCGPAGIFLLLPPESQSTRFSILDPLLDRYKEMFPLSFGRCTEIHSALETWDFDSQQFFDVIFAINCIDHCSNIHKFLGQLQRLTSKDGRLVVAVNTHQRQWTARLWTHLQKLIEPEHPFHFTADDYAQLFQQYFDIESLLDIEDEIIWINNQIASNREQRGIGDRFISAVRIVKPVNAFFGFFNLIGLPAHDFNGRGNSIYRHKAFLLKPRKGHSQ